MRHGKYRFIIGFLAIPLALYGVLVISPFLQDFQISMTSWSGLTPEKNFIGLDNYQKLIHNDLFWKALWHNVLLLLLRAGRHAGLRSLLRLHAECRRPPQRFRGGRRRAGLRPLQGRSSSSRRSSRSRSSRSCGSRSTTPTPRTGCSTRSLASVGLELAPAVLARRLQHRADLHHGRDGLGERRLLRRPVLRRHGLHPRRDLRGGPAGRRLAGSRRSSGSPCRCCATPWPPPGSTWASSPWTPSSTYS